jgi:hypothetical protein
MKRVTVCVLVLVLCLVFSGSAFAAEKKPEMKPDVTLKLSEGQVALGIWMELGKRCLDL